MKEEWRCAEMRSGVLSVTTTGLLRMLVWHADSSDIPGIVCNKYSVIAIASHPGHVGEVSSKWPGYEARCLYARVSATTICNDMLTEQTVHGCSFQLNSYVATS